MRETFDAWLAWHDGKRQSADPVRTVLVRVMNQWAHQAPSRGPWKQAILRAMLALIDQVITTSAVPYDDRVALLRLASPWLLSLNEHPLALQLLRRATDQVPGVVLGAGMPPVLHLKAALLCGRITDDEGDPAKFREAWSIA